MRFFLIRHPQFVAEFFLEGFLLVKALAEEALDCARREREIRNVLGLMN
jgi:hypothetical protein